MIVILLTLVTVVPTLFSVPYFPQIPSILIIVYLITRFRKVRKLRSIRKLAEREGKENEIEIGIKTKNESDFIDKTMDILAHITASPIISMLILALFGYATPSATVLLLITFVLSLLIVVLIYWYAPDYEDKRKWEKHYRDFCKSYMDDRYQEFLREERKQKHQEDIEEEHKRRWIAKHGDHPPYVDFEEKRFEDRRKGWGDRREDGRSEDRRQPDGERRIYLS